ncbi:MAG: hypothetical protein Q9227_008030 [Pyrenula ochraceoflavens]
MPPPARPPPPQTQTHTHYLHSPILAYYYTSLLKLHAVIPTDVDNFYLNLLPLYFPPSQNFGLESPSPPPLSPSSTTNDLTASIFHPESIPSRSAAPQPVIRAVRHHHYHHYHCYPAHFPNAALSEIRILILCSTLTYTGASWSDFLAQLISQKDISPTFLSPNCHGYHQQQTRERKKTVYLILARETHLRFYHLPPSPGAEAEEYPGTEGRTFQLSKDETEIDRVLREWKEEILGGVEVAEV